MKLSDDVVCQMIYDVYPEIVIFDIARRCFTRDVSKTDIVGQRAAMLEMPGVGVTSPIKEGASLYKTIYLCSVRISIAGREATLCYLSHPYAQLNSSESDGAFELPHVRDT